MSKTYAEKLKDPKWQRKRLEIMQRDNFTCQICQDTETTLNVHHTVYSKGAEPWEYPPEQLITLCQPCHTQESELLESAMHDLFRIMRQKGLMSSHFHALAQVFIETDVQGLAPSWGDKVYMMQYMHLSLTIPGELRKMIDHFENKRKEEDGKKND